MCPSAPTPAGVKSTSGGAAARNPSILLPARLITQRYATSLHAPQLTSTSMPPESASTSSQHDNSRHPSCPRRCCPGSQTGMYASTSHSTVCAGHDHRQGSSLGQDTYTLHQAKRCISYAEHEAEVRIILWYCSMVVPRITPRIKCLAWLLSLGTCLIGKRPRRRRETASLLLYCSSGHRQYSSAVVLHCSSLALQQSCTNHMARHCQDSMLMQ